MQIISKLKKIIKDYKKDHQYTTTFRLANIEKDNDDNYIAVVQLIGKNIILKMKPEKILADDTLTNKFSKTDVRNLAFFGYLGINKPEYKLLAEQITQDNKFIFACVHKDSKKVNLKTASEMLADKEINQSLDDTDKQRIAYIAGLESTHQPTSTSEVHAPCSPEITNSFRPKMSNMMKKLYGKRNAQTVFDTCQATDPYFNKFVQEIIYDQIWCIPGLPLTEKSLVTIVTLSTIEKHEQLDIHLSGYLNIESAAVKINEVFYYMEDKKFITEDQLEGILKTVKNLGLDNAAPSKNTMLLSDREEAIINIAHFVAKSAYIHLGNSMKETLKMGVLSRQDIANIMRHQMIYCGCPCTMNGFGVLNKIVS